MGQELFDACKQKLEITEEEDYFSISFRKGDTRVNEIISFMHRGSAVYRIPLPPSPSATLPYLPRSSRVYAVFYLVPVASKWPKGL